MSLQNTPVAQPSLDLASIKADFPILQRKMNGKPLVFLDSAASSQKPKQVMDAISDYYANRHANIHRGVYQLSQEATDAFEQVREKVRAFLNAGHSHEVIFTRGATESINLVASSYGRSHFKPGDEILLSRMEHHSNIVPWQLIAEQTGANIKVIPIFESGEIDLEAYRQMLSNRVKMVAIPHISNALGTINPVKSMIELAHENGTPVLLDGAQATPHLQPDVQALDVDFYVFSGHKMYGPTGIGGLYGKTELLNAMPPYHGGGEMIIRVSFEQTTYNELPFKFEAGTPNIAGTIGLGAAIDYTMNLGYEAIQAHEAELLDYATKQLSSIEGMKIYGTSKEKASVISFLIEGLHPYDVGAILDKLGIAVRTGHHCTQPLMDWYGIPGTVRASFGLYNTLEDIDLLVQGINTAIRMLK